MCYAVRSKNLSAEFLGNVWHIKFCNSCFVRSIVANYALRHFFKTRSSLHTAPDQTGHVKTQTEDCADWQFF